ncbi:type VII secretion-associated serine protease mycosin [Dactylosporangium sp. CA-233914]|uniref:type VII secretion-associated serine protease mycosin n=1 Tax=Dactylosporangium sp. CA-233914 TaxID=3239934 RepID=UPI003D8E4191
MQRKRWFAAIAALAAAVSTLGVPARATAGPPPAGVCNNPAKPGDVVKDTPWPQQAFGAQRIWPTTTGAGITVAVVDSGVDNAHPQLAGQVLPGFDFLRNAAGADFDCTSHGTAVASLIAAKHVNGVGFEGLAQGVKILPIRVSDHEEGTNGEAVTPDVFAKAIRYAADQNARIINISLSLDADYPVVAQAVDYAINTKGCLVVAAVGNHHVTAQQSPPSIGSAKNPIPSDPASYPAGYPGVLGVAAVNQDGTRVDESQVGPYVDIAAPGNLVLGATRVSGHQYWKGTSFAAPIVSGAAALVWASQPNLKNSDVSWRLQVTADRMAGAGRSNEFGYGMVDPYRAVFERPSKDEAVSPTPIPPAATDPAAAARLSRWQTAGRIALIAGLAVLLAALVIFALRAAVRRGRVRAWRPGEVREAPRPQRDPDIEPEDVFFALPNRSRTD